MQKSNQSPFNQVDTATMNMYDICINSIVSQLRDKEQNKEFNFDDFESALYNKIFIESLNYAVNNLDQDKDRLFLDSYQVTSTPQELISKLSIESATNPRFAQSLMNGIIQQYINLSIEYRVVPEEKIISSVIN